MDKVIVYVDDAAYAQQVLGPLFAKSTQGASAARTQWVLVACAPRMTHRISKWVSHSARENWRAKWADKLFDQVVPVLRERGDTVTPILAKGPLPELTRSLMAEHGTARIIDARRLGLMKPTAILINTARGSVVHEAELAQALRDNVIWAAGLDVYEKEPVVHPDLLGLDNAVLLPHLGSATIETRNEMGMRAATNIDAFFQGEEPRDRIA